VKINVEVYLAKGMSTPLILRNDFVDQYSISVILQEESRFKEFGDSGQRMPMNNSVSHLFLDEDGHAFKLCILKTAAQPNH
jgi:hypothetical protein